MRIPLLEELENYERRVLRGEPGIDVAPYKERVLEEALLNAEMLIGELRNIGGDLPETIYRCRQDGCDISLKKDLNGDYRCSKHNFDIGRIEETKED